MHVPYSALNTGHLGSAYCRKMADSRRRRIAREEVRIATEQVFRVKTALLESVSAFKYLGRPLSSSDNDWPAIYRNLAKARKRWALVARVLRRDDAKPKVMAIFYKAIVQSVLLYGCETWVITPRVLQVLGGFHHRVARRLSGLMPRFLPQEERWDYPPIEDALREAGMYSIKHYIGVRQNTLAEQVATRPILELCEGTEPASGSPSRLYWWTQARCSVENLL